MHGTESTCTCVWENQSKFLVDPVHQVHDDHVAHNVHVHVGCRSSLQGHMVIFGLGVPVNGYGNMKHLSQVCAFA